MSRSIDIEGFSEADHVERVIRGSKTFYESDLLQHIAMTGPRGGIFVDIGAHIGNHSMFFALFLADRVVCVEPNEIARRLLERNLRENGITNTTVFPYGAGERSGHGRVKLPGGGESNQGMAQLEIVDRDGVDTIRVMSLDEIVDTALTSTPALPVNLIKIDVEDMELEVLLGAGRTLARWKPQLIVELRSESLRNNVMSFLSKPGYVSAGQYCATPTYHLIVPGHHQLRPFPSRFLRSWHWGKLKRWRTLS